MAIGTIGLHMKYNLATGDKSLEDVTQKLSAASRFDSTVAALEDKLFSVRQRKNQSDLTPWKRAVKYNDLVKEEISRCGLVHPFRRRTPSKSPRYHGRGNRQGV